MKATPLLTALSVLCPALALGATHSVLSTQGGNVSEPGGSYTTTSNQSYFYWVEGTTQAASSAWLKTSTNDVFVFDLVSVTSPTTNFAIVGQWNIRKNGVLVCSACAGQAYGFNGGSFKFYGGPAGNTSGYGFWGSVTSRSDY